MAAQLVGGSQSGLQIHQTAGAQAAEIGAPEGLGQKIKLKKAFRSRGYRQAATVDGNAVPELGVGRQFGSLKGQPGSCWGQFDSGNGAAFLDKACEHKGSRVTGDPVRGKR